MRSRTLQVRFESQADLRAEFDKNIANRGIFVATDADLQVRQAVGVEIVLAYQSPGEPAMVLSGEIVHRVAPSLTRSGLRPGVAVQFEESVAELRARFEPLLGGGPLPDPDTDQQGERRRSARREPVRVPLQVRVGKRPPFPATSRDLSASGVLVSLGREPIAVGEIVRIGLRHPSGEPAIELVGKVVRDVKNKQGVVAAVAVAFDRRQSADPRAREIIDALRQASHQGRLGGISGSIVDVGLANMLQMFGQSAPQGTLVVERDGEQGWIAFANNCFLAAELGAKKGKEALAAMLAWRDGRFEFEARIAAGLGDSVRGEPLAGAVLAAVCSQDEARRPASAVARPAAREARSGRARGGAAPSAALSPGAVFVVDLEQAELAQASLEKTEQAVLDLARSGMSLARIEAIIPESGEEIRTAIASLVEMGVLSVG